MLCYSMSLSGHKGFRKSTFLKCSNWALRGQRLSLKMFQLSWKLMGMILTIFWTSLRYLGIDSRALRGTIGRLFSFLWLYNQPFYMPPNLPRALRKGAVSSGTFVLAPFLTICFFFYKLHRISTRLGQNHQWVNGYKSYQQFDLKGQVGVTGVKNVKKFCFYGKCYSSYMLHSRVTWLRYINKLETLYKTYWLKSRFFVIWGHRGQKFSFTKNASPHTIYIVWSRDLCI